MKLLGDPALPKPERYSDWSWSLTFRYEQEAKKRKGKFRRITAALLFLVPPRGTNFNPVLVKKAAVACSLDDRFVKEEGRKLSLTHLCKLIEVSDSVNNRLIEALYKTYNKRARR